MPRGSRNGEATPTIDNPPKPPKEQLSLNLDQDTAADYLKQYSALQQQMDDLRTKMSNCMQGFEKAGGDRKALKAIAKLKRQDISKTISERRAYNQYFDWFIQPDIDAAADETEH